MILHILLVAALPACLAEFTIQGSSDGNESAQGIKFSEEKGLEYIGGSDGARDFNIQGASDGNSNFHIQGASDGHSNFQIQGASTDGSQIHDARQYNVREPVRYTQPQYSSNQNTGEALSYKDPSGLRVNWRTYTGSRQPRVHQQAEPEYAAESAAPISVPQPAPRAHYARQQAPQQITEQPDPTPVRSSTKPIFIQRLLAMQQQLPYTSGIPEQYRYNHIPSQEAQAQQVKSYFEEAGRQLASLPVQIIMAEPTSHYRSSQRTVRPKREAQHVQQHRQQPQNLKAPVERQPTYSNNLPPELQQLLKYQASLPYQIFPNQVQYSPPKPYVPHPVQAPQYRGQQQAHTQAQIGYNEGQGIHPVKENQY